MNKETASPNSEPGESTRRLAWRRRALALSMAGLLLGTVSVDSKGKSGEVKQFHPTAQELADGALRPSTDWLKLASANMHGMVVSQADLVQQTFKREKLDALFIQEASVGAAEKLEEHTEDLYVTSVVADPSREGIYTGQSNLIVTTEPPKEITGKSIDGDILFATAAQSAWEFFKWPFKKLEGEAQAQSPFELAKEARQAQRAALALTIEVQNGDKTEDVRLITGHIAGVDEVEKPQRDELKDFISDNLKPGRRTVFCGDLNASPEVIIPWFAQMGFTVLKTGPTHTNGWQTLDFCAEWDGPNGTRVLASARVEKSFESDHFTVIVEGELMKPENIAQKYPRGASSRQEMLNELKLHQPSSSAPAEPEPHKPDALGFTAPD